MTYDKSFKLQAVALSQEIGIKQAAKQLDIPYYTLVDWRQRQQQFGKQQAHVGSGNKRALQENNAQITELEKELDRLRRANDILQEALGFFSGPKEATVHLRYRFIHDKKGKRRVREFCEVLGVSESGYYRYAKRHALSEEPKPQSA